MRRLLVLLSAAAVWVVPAAARQSAPLAELLNATIFRNIGPFRTSAWVTEIAVPETPARDRLYTIYAATRTGGLWKTVNNGTTWVSVSGNLVDSPINVVVQDRRNANLLIVGNDRGVWVSIDGGSRWERLKANLPTVPVHDLTIHPRENDLALGTYGRGIFLADITHLQELSADVLAKPFHLFNVEPRAPYNFRALGNYHLFGHAYIEVPNEPDALVINYSLRARHEAGARVAISNMRGEQVAELKGPAEAGLNRVHWNMRAGNAPAGRRGGFAGRGAGPTLPPGEYRITVDVGGRQQTTIGRIRERIRPPV